MGSGVFLALLWLFGLLAAWMAILAFWSGDPGDRGPRMRLLPILGTAAICAFAGCVLSLGIWAETSGLRPSHVMAATAWFILVLGCALVCLRSGMRPRAFSRPKLLLGSVGAAALAVAAYVLADAAALPALEERLELAVKRFEELKPPVLDPGQDARPIYDRAFALMGEKKVPDWAGKPAAAVRARPEKVRELLEEYSEALEIAKEARGRPGYRLEFPVSAMLDAGREDNEAMGIWLGMRSLARLVSLQGAQLANEGQASGVEDHLHWIGDLARQMLNGPSVMDLLIGLALVESRTSLLEAAIGLLGERAGGAVYRLGAVAGPDLDKLVERRIASEVEMFSYLVLSLMLDRVPLEDLLRPRHPGANLNVPGLHFVHGEELRFYRVFGIPANLGALERHGAEATRRIREWKPGEGLEPSREEFRDLGGGPMVNPAIYSLHKFFRLALRARTSERVAIAGLALAAHRQAAGAYPGRLEDIDRKLLPEVPRDAFLDQPLRYERLGQDGAVVHSAWDGRSDKPATWAMTRKTTPSLVFFLGTALEEHGREELEPGDFEEAEEE